jgi:hypothetical protein
MEVDELPKMIELSEDESEQLSTLQAMVGGYIDILGVRGDGLEFVVNDCGLINGMPPNRVIYADKDMVAAGYYSQINGQQVHEDDLYAILFGNVVAARYDEDGNMVSVTDEDLKTLQAEMPDSIEAMIELRNLQLQLEERKI